MGKKILKRSVWDEDKKEKKKLFHCDVAKEERFDYVNGLDQRNLRENFREEL